MYCTDVMLHKFLLLHLVLEHCTQIISEKDQGQYWFLDGDHQYVPVTKFVEGYQSFCVGKLLAEELSVPFDKRYNHPAALSTNTYAIRRVELLKLSFSWQMLLLKRNSFVFVFKFMQVISF